MSVCAPAGAPMEGAPHYLKPGAKGQGSRWGLWAGDMGGRVFEAPSWARNWEAMDIGKTGLGKWEKDQVDFARRERVRLTDEAAERARLAARAGGRRERAL